MVESHTSTLHLSSALNEGAYVNTNPSFVTSPENYYAELLYWDVLYKEIKILPKIESPIGLEILPIDLDTSQWMIGPSFDEIETPISRPTWVDIRSKSSDNKVQLLIVGLIGPE